MFICVIVLSAGLLLLGSCYLGLGEGSACTDVPGNGGLDRAPCNRVTHGLMLNVISQATFFVIAWLAGGRRRSHQWMAWTLLACSLGTFIASLAIARSY